MTTAGRWLVGLVLILMPFYIAALQSSTLQVVTELSPPHQTLVDGEVSGDSTALVKAILQQAGIVAGIEMYPWARAYRMALQQPDTLIYNIARTAEREPLFHWIGPVAAYRLGFVTLAHRHDIQLASVADAKQYRIAVQRHDIAETYLKAHGFNQPGQLMLAADIVESWQLLLNDKVDLIIDDPMALVAMATHLQVKPAHVKFVFAIDALEQQTYLAASKATSTEIISALQQAHRQVAASEQYQRVMRSEFD